MGVAVSILAFALEVGERRFPILYNVERDSLRRRLCCDPQQIRVVTVVFHHQNILGEVSPAYQHAL